MLGYGTETKAYCLYDVEREKVFFSRDVVFNETMNGIDKEPEIKSSDSKHVELECIEEDTSAETVVNESLQLTHHSIEMFNKGTKTTRFLW